MKRKIIYPEVAVKLSIKAYHNAAKEFNSIQEKDFINKRKDYKEKTIKALLLKEEHHQVFYTLINYYKEKLETLNQFFQGSDSINAYIAPHANMMLTTGRLAKHLQRANNTIRKRLKRLEKAGILKVVFHGHKKPLEIIFNQNICIIFDKSNPDYIPQSNFLSHSETDFFGINSKNVHDKESTFSGTKYNITITEKDVLPDANLEKTNSNRKRQNNLNHTENFSGTAEKSGTKETEFRTKRKKVPQKKEKENVPRTGLDRKLAEKKVKQEFRNLSSEEKKERFRTQRAEELKRRKEEALKYYSNEFYAYLIANLFPDKYLAPHYRRETLGYIAKQYFSKARTIQSMEVWLKEYKKRIDISKKWIDAYRTPGNKPFDKTYFFPKAYLDVEKTGSKSLSFVNTRKFLKKEKEWEKINGYNRKTEKDLRHKLNKIVRELENGFINYDTALQRVKSLTNKTDEYVKQLHARYFGMYKTMQNS